MEAENSSEMAVTVYHSIISPYTSIFIKNSVNTSNHKQWN